MEVERNNKEKRTGVNGGYKDTEKWIYLCASRVKQISYIIEIYLQLTLAPMRTHPGKRLVQKNPEGVDVCRQAVLLHPRDLRGPVRRRSRPPLDLIDMDRETQVAKLGSFLRDQDIRRLDIPVEEATAVEILYSLCNIPSKLLDHLNFQSRHGVVVLIVPKSLEM